MKVFNIKLSTIEEVRQFVNNVSKYDYEIDLKSGRYVVEYAKLDTMYQLSQATIKIIGPIEKPNSNIKLFEKTSLFFYIVKNLYKLWKQLFFKC